MDLVIERQAYDTHFNYIKCLFDLTNGVAIKYTGGLKKATTPFLEEKKNLISLTKKSLNDEYKIVLMDKDYSYASTSWLPIKSYYLIFNVLLTVEYIFKLQKNIYNTGHVSCIDEFTRKLSSGEINFSQPILNQVFDKNILTYKITSGANLSRRTSMADRYKMVLRKIAWYKEGDWKRKNNINLHKTTHKARYQNYLNSFAVSIFDFPYYMRIRSNYRDFAFIDGIDTSETAEYFKKYFGFTVHFVGALDKMKNNLVALRT
ncbi:MAG: hypothetical protein NTV77_03465 [Candidatus Azambacteria bacterium]|nr:hypothetical protein [Candidatus Azambacteria bacterium]